MLDFSTCTTSFETIYNEPKTFRDELTKLETERFLFRGVEKRSFHAQAHAFRLSNIEDNRKKFPVPYKQILTEWFYHSDIIKIIQPWCAYTESEIRCHPTIHRLFNLLSYLQVCNYLFSKYKENNPHHILEKDRQHLEDRGSTFWAARRTFNCMVKYYFPLLLTREALDKSWRKEGHINGTVSGIDLSFPQHFGTGTAALDLTKK